MTKSQLLRGLHSGWTEPWIQVWKEGWMSPWWDKSLFTSLYGKGKKKPFYSTARGFQVCWNQQHDKTLPMPPLARGNGYTNMIGKPSSGSVPRPKAVASLLLLCLSLFFPFYPAHVILVHLGLLVCRSTAVSPCSLLCSSVWNLKSITTGEWDEHVRILDTLFPEPLTIAGFDVFGFFPKNLFVVFLF